MTRHHYEPGGAGSGPDAGAVGEPALVEPGLDPGGLHPEDVLVRQEPAGAGWQPVQGVRGVVVGPGEAGGVTRLVSVVRAEAGAVLPVRLLGLVDHGAGLGVD